MVLKILLQVGGGWPPVDRVTGHLFSLKTSIPQRMS